MLRIRTVKPELFTHDGLYDLEVETGLPIRLAFIALFTACDREGRFKWRPRQLGAQLLPYDLLDFSRVLDALTTRGFVQKYTVSGEEFGVIPTFTRHQLVNNRESASDLPKPPPDLICDACPTRAPRVPHATQGEGKGREGNRREGESTLSLDSDEIHPPAESPELPLSCEDAFQKFWDAYPKKKSKPDALRAWQKLKLSAKLPEILAAIEVAKKSVEWADPQFISYPASWLNASGWEDEYLPAASNPVGSGPRFGSEKKEAADFVPGLGGPKVLYDSDLPEPDFDWKGIMRDLFENPNTDLPWGHVPPAVRSEVISEAAKKRGAA